LYAASITAAGSRVPKSRALESGGDQLHEPISAKYGCGEAAGDDSEKKDSRDGVFHGESSDAKAAPSETLVIK
jgi:hypothetical protein